ncbi:hypothetical protein SUDANB2_04723 [Streptomyces sp. enrichment culture]
MIRKTSARVTSDLAWFESAAQLPPSPRSGHWPRLSLLVMLMDSVALPAARHPRYAIFDPSTGTGAVLTDIHPTPDGPGYATRKDFVYGEDVTTGEWTIPTRDLPRYQGEGEKEPES